MQVPCSELINVILDVLLKCYNRCYGGTRYKEVLVDMYSYVIIYVL